MDWEKAVFVVTAVATGLIAGLFFGYQTSVNPAWRTLSDREYISAMQAINVAIQNPLFLSLFMGNVLLLGALTYLHRGQQTVFPCLVAATLLYVVGVFDVTIACNVPLNDALARVSLSTSDAEQLAAARNSFQNPWNAWHSLRTWASVFCFALVIFAGVSVNRERITSGIADRHATR